MVKNILITGGAGYIGSHTAEILIQNNKKVFIADDLSTGFKKLVNNKAKFYKVNILNDKKSSNYTDQSTIDNEIRESKKMFQSRQIPMIDVTRKSVEETAASIIKIYEITKK